MNEARMPKLIGDVFGDADAVETAFSKWLVKNY